MSQTLVFSLLENVPLVASFSAIFLAQAVKIPLHFLYHREWDWSRFFGSGGMPSSHSAGVMALASSSGYREGVGSTMFAITCVLGLIVMYDAMGIRRHAGEQAMAINELEEAFDKHIETDDPEFSRRGLRRQRKHLKELLGHQPIEVAGGAAFGVAVGLVYSLILT
ncbi:divergent PAP2 family protein [Tumebacillus amylolyticus]|uniref:divergent PAP2 family protein n=1 Tax=Tumebacillus amylolyticus TaxID=2801339 RepID=UPI0032214EE1